MNKKDELRVAVEYLDACLRDIHTKAEGRALDADEQKRFDEGLAERKNLADQFDALEARDKQIADLRALHAAGETRTEDGDGAKRFNVPNVNKDSDPFAVLESRGVGMSDVEFSRALVDGAIRANEDRIEDADNQKHFERTLKRHAKDTRWAAGILARSRPEYESAFAKVMTGDVMSLTDEERTSLSVGSNTNGGFLVPTHLDPTIILTNSGTSNVIRGISRVVTLTEGTVWNGVTSAGVTASFDAELAEVSDDSPTFGRVSVSVHKAQSLVQASIEAFQDISGLASDVLMLFADARDRLEGAAHATGTGTGQPFGIYTALDANTNVEILTTTANVIGLVDVHNVYRQVPVRWRNRSTWLMHPLWSLEIKALGDAVSASYSGDLREPTAGRILGRPLVESDDAPSTETTTVRDNTLILGDFSNYVVVDKPGSMAVEFIPHLFATANNLPDGRRGWYAHWRTGADSVNDVAFRLLQETTSA